MDELLLQGLLKALTPLGGSAPHFRNAYFQDTQIMGPLALDGVQFTNDADFSGAEFHGDAWFGRAQFKGVARFTGAEFLGRTNFTKAQFAEQAVFESAQFRSDTYFRQSEFSASARFDWVQFHEYVDFSKARFYNIARFADTRFHVKPSFEPTSFTKRVTFSGARFERGWYATMMCQEEFLARGVVIEQELRLRIAASQADFIAARFASSAVISGRYAAVDLTDAVLNGPLTVVSLPSPIMVDGTAVSEENWSGDGRISVTNLSGLDAANIALNDVDISRCEFSGAFHLDQIRLEGKCTFAQSPRGWRFGRALFPVRRWSSRKVLAEEVAWRAAEMPHRSALARSGWPEPSSDPRSESNPSPTPARLEVLYRQLRKALEDSKDTPGAADFYYGEMEMRRHDREAPRGERALLHVYWLLSGYALRASRALGFLAATATITFLLMMGIGLPDTQSSTPSTVSAPAPTLALPWTQRFTAERANQAGLVVVNSVIFRSTDNTLTGPGTWIEIVSRIGEPVLLGFAAVAARGRVQR